MKTVKTLLAGAVMMASATSMAATSDTLTVELVIGNSLSFDFTETSVSIDPDATATTISSTDYIEGDSSTAALESNVPYTVTFSSANDWLLCNTDGSDCSVSSQQIPYGFVYGSLDSSLNETAITSSLTPAGAQTVESGSSIVSLATATTKNRYVAPYIEDGDQDGVKAGTYQDVITGLIAAQ